MLTITRLLLAGSLLLPACYAEDHAEYGVGASADLVEISPGVEVVADYDRPIFFADDLYWWLDGGVWYQSTWYGGGWARASRVSPRIVAIAHPESYAHYRPTGVVPRHGGATPVARRAPGFRGGVIRSRPAPRGGRHH